MALKSVGLTLVLALLLLSAGCASWQNPATGESQGSPPTYPQCQKPEVVRSLDQDCWRACMDRWFRLRGNVNAGACDLECNTGPGQTVMVDDDDCNAEKARQEGWVFQRRYLPW